MLNVKKEGIVLEKTTLDFENEGVLNPAAIREGEFVHLFYRAVQKGNHSTIGYCKLDGPLEIEDLHYKPILILLRFLDLFLLHLPGHVKIWISKHLKADLTISEVA